jgi:hypothetical protein
VGRINLNDDIVNVAKEQLHDAILKVTTQVKDMQADIQAVGDNVRTVKSRHAVDVKHKVVDIRNLLLKS